MKKAPRSELRKSPATLRGDNLAARAFTREMETGSSFAVISDIHGNLEALQGVLAFLDTRNVSTIISLGDIVGYGASPCECITVIRDRGILSLRGNHDAGAATESSLSGWSSSAMIGLRYSRRCLSTEDRTFLRHLPMEILLPRMAFVHASYPRPGAWAYVSDTSEARRHLLTQPRGISFFGHTHRPGGFVDGLSRIVALDPEPTVSFDWEERACFNPGAVGQPRDRDPRAALLLCHPALNLIEFHRVAYDYERATDAIARAGLPERFADRLRTGQ